MWLYVIKQRNICTLRQLVPFLYGMNGRWKYIIMYPYTGTKYLLYYGVCGYNFAMLDYKEQNCNNKYICDPSLLKNGRYSRKELLKIAEVLGIKVRKNINRYKLQDLLYTAM